MVCCISIALTIDDDLTAMLRAVAQEGWCQPVGSHNGAASSSSGHGYAATTAKPVPNALCRVRADPLGRCPKETTLSGRFKRNPIRSFGKGRFRRNPVVAAHPGDGPFTIPLRTLLIVVATGGVGVHELRPGGRRRRWRDSNSRSRCPGCRYGWLGGISFR